MDIDRALHRAVVNGPISGRDAQEWLAEQRRRADADDFRAEIPKILWVATTPA